MPDDQTAISAAAVIPPTPAEGPLTPFKGREPPAPDWFKWAIAQAPERSFIDVLGAQIELLTWGERGKPGLVLLHGNTAHADWWSFIAPFLAEDYRVAAISLSGMGGSDWRAAYSSETFSQELRAAALAAGLYEAPVKPVFIGHSFGGSQVFYAARRHPDWMQAAVLVDTGFGGPPPATEGFRHPTARTQPHRVYPTLTEALTRFRLMPPQGCENPFIADFIARRSLKPAPLEGGGQGWTWRFDPQLWLKLDRAAMESLLLEKSLTPLVHIIGGKSNVMDRVRHAADPDGLLLAVPQVIIPDSEHHVMIDQPLALVAAIRALLVGWP
jgi:pimeloyl-ACP methyl ester carboxylesterase